MTKLLLVTALLCVISCVHVTNDTPSSPSKSREPQSSQEFIQGSAVILREIQDPAVFNGRTCAAYIGGLTQRLFNLPTKYFVPSSAGEVAELKAQGPQVLSNLFTARLKLREKLKSFHEDGSVTPACVSATREGNRYLRFAEEMLIEWLQIKGVYGKKQPHIMDGPAPHTLVNPAFGRAEIKAGDLMLVRGKSYVSAMIARIGDEEGQFSHLALVGQDSRGKLHVIEALIQYGTIVTPLEKWREEKDSRVVLYRYPDAAVAQRAARIMYDKAAGPAASGNNIHYDFEMNDNDGSTLFCAEVASYAFKNATNGQLRLPLHRTTISKFKGTEYLHDMGIPGDSFFAPADMEVDVRFDMIAEYRHWPLLRQVRMQDSVLASIYSWMIDRKYTFHWSAFHGGKQFLAKFLRQFGLLKDKLPTYMPSNTLRTTLQFESAATALEENLYEKEAAYFNANGHSMTFKDMLAINEAFRREDCRRFAEASSAMADPGYPVAGNSSKIHWFFSSPRGCN